jgi:hypothetical protein
MMNREMISMSESPHSTWRGGRNTVKTNMRKAQFANAVKACERQTTIAGLGAVIVWGAIVFVGINQYGERLRSCSEFVFGGLLAISLVALMTVVIFAARIIHKRNGVICSSCGNWIGDQKRMLATGKCPRCKTEVYTEDSA